MKMYSRDGMEMMDLKSIERDGERLVLKGKIMGAMGTTIVIGPEDCWQAAKLLGIRLIARLPLILLKGFIQSRKRQASPP